MTEDNVTSKNQRVPEDIAEEEFQRFAEEMEIDVDESKMFGEDRDNFLNLKRKFLGAVIRGRLVVNDNGEPEFTSSTGEHFTFYEPSGATVTEMDKIGKKGGDVAKTHKVMASAMRVSPAAICKLPQRDYKVLQAIFALFMD